MSTPQIITQTENWIVVDKPEGWLSVPSRLGRKDERACIGYWLEEKLGVRVFPVHRLDLEVSGVMIFGLNDDFHRWASGLFEHHKIVKTYSAFTSSCTDFEVGREYVWENKIVRGKKRSFYAEHGKESRTLALLEQVEGTRAVWSLQPVTGRPHQLRLDLSSRGCAIWGDELYGSGEKWHDGQGIALRAVRLDFKHATGFADWKLQEFYQVAGLTD